MRQIICLLSLLVLTTGKPVAAQPPMNGGELLAQCTTPPTSALYANDWAACTYYIKGFAEGGQAFEELSSEVAPRHLCVPAFIKVGDLRDTVVLYLQTYPDIQRQPAQVAVFTALLATFPCKS